MQNYNKTYSVKCVVHYANAIIDNTENYKEAIAIGVNDYLNDNGFSTEIGVYFILEG